MGIWTISDESKRILQSELSAESAAIEDLYALADEVVVALGVASEIPACHIGALALLKARRLATASYYLSLNCLAQEGGATFRPLQEAWEFLIFIAQEPSRAKAVAEGKAPSAGTVAKAIGGQFKAMRDYLNTNASHLSFTPEAIGHLLDAETGRLRVANHPQAGVIKKNMAPMFGVTFLAVGEGIRLVSLIDLEQFNSFASRHQELQSRTYRMFKDVVNVTGM